MADFFEHITEQRLCEKLTFFTKQGADFVYS